MKRSFMLSLSQNHYHSSELLAHLIPTFPVNYSRKRFPILFGTYEVDNHFSSPSKLHCLIPNNLFIRYI